MNGIVLFYCYGSICEPYLSNSFQRIGYEVATIKTSEMNMEFQPEILLLETEKKIDELCPEFVFSIDFYPQISDICQKKGLRYVSLTVNVPVNTLFCKALGNDNNRTFLFDRSQYEQFKGANPNRIGYLPLAAPFMDMDQVIRYSSAMDRKRFISDISFVGSLYTQSDEYTKFMPYLSEHTRGFLDGVLEAQCKLPGGFALKECVTKEIVEEIAKLSPELTAGSEDVSYVVTHYLLGKHLAVTERNRYLNALADCFSLDLYTNSSPEIIRKAHFKGLADSYKEMPIIFANSKININITYRAIETGLPQRIWDVLGCGGFLLTTYSEELPEYFEIGNDLDIFTCEEELVEKASFYLEHDEIRKQIAKNGCEKVKKYHTYEIRLKELLERI